MKPVSKKDAVNTGMSMTLIFLICHLSFKHEELLYGALACLLVNMIVPSWYTPVALVWSGLTRLGGAVTSHAGLTAIFILLVVPVGLIRKWLGKDSMNLKMWKTGRASVFSIHEKTYTHKDMKHPF